MAKLLVGELITTPLHLPQTNEYVTSPADRCYVTSETGEMPSFTSHMDDESYAEMLSGTVNKCVDIIPFDPKSDRILIGTRDQKPWPSDWVIGGSHKPGNFDVKAAVINLERELKLTIDPESLVLGDKFYQLVWKDREQTPTRNEAGQLITGVHQITRIAALPLDESKLQFNEEYSGLRWIDPDEIMNAKPGTFHPALVRMVEDTMERITRPDQPASLAERHLRAVGQLATVEAQMHREASR